jgi:SHOCT-like protein
MMNDNRRQILEMLAAGKITAAEADRLLAALDPTPTTVEFSGTIRGDEGAQVKTRAKYLRVLVEANEEMTGLKGATTVNVRVPMQLLRAGVRLASLIPQQAHNQLDQALSKHGVPITLSQIKPENLEELIDHLEDLTVDVDGSDGNTTKVRVFCE